MSSEFMRQVANVLEKVAEHLDQQEHQQQETARVQHEQMAKALNEKYAAITGEELSPEVLERMSDETILRAVEKLTEKTAATTTTASSNEEPEAMGEGANIDNRNTQSRQERVKQAADDADQHFLDWVMD